MNLSKKKSKFICLSICVVLTLLIAISCAISVTGNIKIEDNAQAATVVPGTASVLNLTEEGVAQNNFSSVITGAQNEYIYFGSNVNSTVENTPGYGNTQQNGAIKWRVLSKSDTKYSNGNNMLLWADYNLGTGSYNAYSENPYYAYWGTSMLRAKLNGGKYLSTVSGASEQPVFNQTVGTNDSWLSKLFNTNERVNIVQTKEYDTYSFSFDGSLSPKMSTSDVIGTGVGRYNSSHVTTMNNLAGNTATIAVENSGSNYGITEKTKDYLFLIDYYDINNINYGFYDVDNSGNKVTYATLLLPSWTPTRWAGYPCSSDDNTIVADYLISPTYWLRPAGRYSTNHSRALRTANGSFYFSNTDYVCGVRPAFNFSQASVIYATAASVSSNGTTFAPVNTISSTDGKPAYKVYIKTSNYKNFNNSANSMDAPKISTAGRKVTVKKAGQSGSAIILLADKSGSGEVAYQATASFDANGVASANLPSGINANSYSITVLFAGSVRGEEYAESITGSYTYQGLEIPKATTMIYNSAQRVVTDFNAENWYDDVMADTTLMNVSIPTAVNVNDYNVSFSFKDTEMQWNDGTKETKTINLSIIPQTLSVSIDWTVSPHTPVPIGICANDQIYENQILQVKYTDDSGGVLSGEPTKVGKYNAVVEFNQSVSVYKNYKFDKTYDHKIDIDIIPISLPTLSPTSYEYNSRTRYFQITFANDNDSNNVAYTLDNDYGGLVTLNSDEIQITKGGTYTNVIKLHLKNGYDPISGDGRYVWDDTENSQDRYLPDTITITPKALEEFAIQEASGGILNGKTEGTLAVTMDYIKSMPFEGDSVEYVVKATGHNNIYIIANGQVLNLKTENNVTYSQKITLDFSKMHYEDDYTISVEVVDSEKSYTVALSSPITLKLTEPTGSDNLKWRLEKDGTLTPDAPVVAEIGETSKAFPTAKIYDGSVYVFNVIKPDGYDKGLVTYTKDGSPVNEMRDAGQYVATVTLSSGGATQDYTVTFEITPYKFNLSNVKWENDGIYEYTGSSITPSLTGLPSELEVKDLIGANTSGTAVKTYGEVTVTFKVAGGYTESNYILPEKDENNYDGNFTWSISWGIVPVQIKLNWEYTDAEDINDVPFRALVLSDSRVADKIDYLYYETNSSGEILDENAESLTLDEIEVIATQVKYYKAYPVLQSLYEGDYVFPDGADLYSPVFSVGGDSTAITVSLSTTEYEYNGKPVTLKWVTGTPTGSLTFTYYAGDAFGVNKLDSAPKDVGTYWVEVKSNNASVVLSGDTRFQFKINRSVISTQWKTSAKPPVLGNLKSIQLKEGIEYEYYDADMHKINYSDLSKGGTFKIRAILKDNRNFEFDNGEVETETIEFTVAPGEELRDPSDINNPNYNFDDEENPPGKKPDITIEWDKTKNPPELKIPDEYKDDIHPEYEYFDKDGNPVNPEDMVDGEDYTVKVKIPDDEKDKFNFVDKTGNTVDPDNIPQCEFEKKADKASDGLDKVGEFLQKYWQPIVTAISIILIIIFMSKGIGYANKSKRLKKTIEKKYSSYYAVAGTGMFGLTYTNWTIMACIAMGVAVLALFFMILEKNMLVKVEEEFADAKEEYERNEKNSDERRREDEYRRSREDDKENLRMMLMSMMGGQGGNMGQGMSQGGYMGGYGIGIEEMRGLISETVTALLPGVQQALPQQASSNDELVEKLIQQNEKLMEKLSEQTIADKVVERQVAVATLNADDATLQKLMERSEKNDERIEQLMKNQEALIAKLLEKDNSPQVVEKIIEKEVPVEKIVEKVVEVPVEVEKIVEKEVKVEVPVEVEKIVEKEVVKEVPVEVERIVEKEIVKEVKVEVPVAVPAPSKPKKEVALRLTLDEAYALLSKQQQKYFDGLRQYALSKPNSKEKKATYAITIGQSTVNPLLKLTIKKDMTVALFKMEDEYLKDIKRDATSDGTKVKVKETEVIIADAQACKVAKNMIDLREDQIERYQDLLKEQRAMKNKK